MIGLIKLHKPGKFHQYTICTFLLTAFQSPRSSWFGPRLGSFSSVTPRIEVQLRAPSVWRVEPSSTLNSIDKDYIKKIPTFIAFCKLLLGDVEVEILLILCRFSVVFWARLPPTIHLHPHVLVFERYSEGTFLGEGSFMSHLWFLSFQISNDFVAAESTISGCFWVVF